jgi:hypothetical protein
MDRTHKIACSLVTLISLIGLTACGDPNSVPRASASSSAKAKGQAPKVIRVASGGMRSAGGMAVPAALPALAVGESGGEPSVHSDSGFASGAVQYLADAALPDLDRTAPSWSFPAGVKPDKAQIAKLAHAFGVTGAVDVVPADQGGGWRVGPDDGTAPSLFVAPDALLSWSINPPFPGAPVDNRGCWGTATPTTTVLGVAPVATAPVICEPTTAPKNVPNKDEALAKVKTLFTSLGYTHLEYEASSDPMGSSVSAYELLGGMRSPRGMSIRYGENGRVDFATGVLAKAVPGDEYPLIGTTAAIARLNEQSAVSDGPFWSMAMGTGIYMNAEGGTAAAGSSPVGPPPTAVAAPPLPTQRVASTSAPAMPEGPITTVAPPSGPPPVAIAGMPTAVEPGSPEPGVVGGDVPAQQVTTITLIDARLDLSTVYGDDGTVWLLPTYAFTSADGFAVSVLAVPDEFIVAVQPPMQAMPSTTAALTNPNEPGQTAPPSPPFPTESPTIPVPSKPGPAATSTPASALTTIPLPTTYAPASTNAAPPPGAQPPTTAVSVIARLTLGAANILVGLSEADAALTAKQQGWVMRVSRQDGADLIVTQDFSARRVNVAVVKGVVTEILTIG